MIKRTLLLVTALFALSAAPAVAQTPGYGGGGPTVALSASVAVVGQNIVFSGTGFHANSSTSIVFNSQTINIATITTNSAGSFTITFPVPHVAPGLHSVTATDAQGSTGTTFVTVIAGTASNAGTSSGLAFTGADIGLMTAGAAALLVIGGLVALSTRKRSA